MKRFLGSALLLGTLLAVSSTARADTRVRFGFGEPDYGRPYYSRGWHPNRFRPHYWGTPVPIAVVAPPCPPPAPVAYYPVAPEPVYVERPVYVAPPISFQLGFNIR